MATEGEEIGLAVGLGIAAIALGYALTRGSVTTAPVNPATGAPAPGGSSSPYGGGGSAGSTPGSPYGSGGSEPSTSGSSSGGTSQAPLPAPVGVQAPLPPTAPPTSPSADLEIIKVDAAETGLPFGVGGTYLGVTVTVQNKGGAVGQGTLSGWIVSRGATVAWLITTPTGNISPGGTDFYPMNAVQPNTTQPWQVPQDLINSNAIVTIVVRIDQKSPAQVPFQLGVVP